MCFIDAELKANESKSMLIKAENKVQLMTQFQSKLKRKLDGLYHELLQVSSKDNNDNIGRSKVAVNDISSLLYWRVVMFNALFTIDNFTSPHFIKYHLNNNESFKINSKLSSNGVKSINIYQPICPHELAGQCNDKV